MPGLTDIVVLCLDCSNTSSPHFCCVRHGTSMQQTLSKLTLCNLFHLWFSCFNKTLNRNLEKLLIFTPQNLFSVHFLCIKYLKFSGLEEVHLFFLVFLSLLPCKIHILIRGMQSKVSKITSYFKIINTQKIFQVMESG